jgi:hypothetical protein
MRKAHMVSRALFSRVLTLAAISVAVVSCGSHYDQAARSNVTEGTSLGGQAAGGVTSATLVGATGGSTVGGVTGGISWGGQAAGGVTSATLGGATGDSTVGGVTGGTSRGGQAAGGVTSATLGGASGGGTVGGVTGGTSWGGQATGGAAGATTPPTGGATSAASTTTNVVPPSGTTSYTPLQYLPSSSDGVPTTVQWIHCATLIVKDNLGLDLVALLRGTKSLHAAVSTDDGSTWQWVDPASAINVDPPLAIAQSADGNIHVISWSWSSGASYSRIALSRDSNKHISGLSAAASGVTFPTNLSYGDMSADIVAGVDQAGNSTLLYSFYDNVGSDGGRVLAGKTSVAAGVSPTAAKDFVALDNTQGATQLDLMSGDSWSAPHNAGVLMAQHPASKDIWFQWGPMNTGDGLTQNTLPLKRLRATPSGASTFAIGTVNTVAMFQSTGVQNYAVTSTPKSVWFLYGTPASALNFDRAASDGSVTKGAIPSPYTTQSSGGFFTMSINSTETEIWLAGQAGLDTNDPNRMKTWAKYWNGSAWTTYSTIVITDNLFRMGRSVGWEHGLAFVQSHFDYDTWRPTIGALRTSSK